MTIVPEYYITEFSGKQFIRGYREQCMYFFRTDDEREQLRRMLENKHKGTNTVYVNLTMIETGIK